MRIEQETTIVSKQRIMVRLRVDSIESVRVLLTLAIFVDEGSNVKPFLSHERSNVSPFMLLNSIDWQAVHHD